LLPGFWASRPKKPPQGIREPDELLRLSEVAKLLRISRATAYRLCSSGQLRHVRIVNSIRIARADLERLLRSSKGG